MKSPLNKLNFDKIKINWNKNPIKMDLFLSFLTIPTEIPKDGWLGDCNGWTKKVGENNLNITGGWVDSVEYLDSIQYKKKLNNPYNNYVSPFDLFEIMTDDGKKFFLDYYKDEIKEMCEKVDAEFERAKKNKEENDKFWGEMFESIQ